MAQQHANSPEIIYEVLVNDTVFMSYVGKRVFKAGNTELNAISIITPGMDMPGVKSISGLEVMIHDVSELSRREYITEEYDIKSVWKVFLLAWEGANGSTLNSAATRIMQLFSKASIIETMPVSDGIGGIAQVIAYIPSDSVII